MIDDKPKSLYTNILFILYNLYTIDLNTHNAFSNYMIYDAVIRQIEREIFISKELKMKTNNTSAKSYLDGQIDSLGNLKQYIDRLHRIKESKK